MTNSRPDTEPQAHLRDYWRTIWAGRRTVVAVFLVVTGVGILATLLQSRVYRATVTLEISPRAQRVVRVDDVSQIGAAGLGWSAEDRYFKTQLEVIRSRDVAERAFVRLNLKDDPLFAEARDPVARFMSSMEVEPTQETLVVTLSMEGPDAEQVAAWVNAVAEAYVDRNFEQAGKATEEAIRSLLDQLEPLRETLRERETDKFRYAREQQIFVPETQKLSYTERLSSLEKDYTATKLKRLELEAVFSKVEELEQAGGDYSVLPRVAQDEVLRALTRERDEHEAEYRKLLVTLKPGHYRMKESEAALDKIEQRILSQTARIIDAVRTEYALAGARERDLDAEIRRTKEEALAVAEKASNYEILSSESDEAKRIYDLVAQRVKEVDLNSSLLRNNLAILDAARPPTSPVRPRRLLNLAVSVLMGLGLGVGLVFLMEYLDSSIRGAEQMEREFGLGTLAVVPTRRPETEVPFKEAFGTLRTTLHFLGRERTRRVVLITSAGPQEGKTLAALELARAMARAGDKVCLVDADLRRPNLHRELEIPPSPGLTTYLRPEGSPVALRSVVRGGGPGEPGVVTCGAAAGSPADLLSSDRFAALVKELKSDNDWVVIDAPPAGGLPDAILAAACSDMIVFVARQGRTDRVAFRRALDSIRVTDAAVVGAVLNDVDLRRRENIELYYPAYDPAAASRAAREPGRARRPAAL